MYKEVETGVGPDSIDAMKPSSVTDFNDFAARVADKLTEFSSSTHYLVCMEKLIRSATGDMKVADIRSLSRTLNAIANEKQKEDKKSAKKAKKKKGGVALKMRANKTTSDFMDDPYMGDDGGDDDFFM